MYFVVFSPHGASDQDEDGTDTTLSLPADPHLIDDVTTDPRQVSEHFPALIQQGRWRAVDELLSVRGVDNHHRQWAVRQAGLHLPALTTQGQWTSVADLLRVKGLDVGHTRWAVDRALESVEKNGLNGNRNDAGTTRTKGLQRVLGLATRKQRARVFSLSVQKGLWVSVAQLLERGVSQYYRKWGVERAARTASSSDLLMLERTLTNPERVRLLVGVAVTTDCGRQRRTCWRRFQGERVSVRCCPRCAQWLRAAEGPRSPRDCLPSTSPWALREVNLPSPHRTPQLS